MFFSYAHGMVIHSNVSPEEAADRLAMRELVDAYAYCADRRDAKGQMATTNSKNALIGVFAVIPKEQTDLRVMSDVPLSESWIR